LVIQPDSSLVGKSLGESNLGQFTGLNILRIIRKNGRHLEARPDMRIERGDVLLVEGRQEDIVKIKDTAGVQIKVDVHFSDPDLQDREIGLLEAIVPPGSPLIGSTLKTGRFRDRYGLQVLGINRRGVNVVRELGHVPIQLGDMLLLQGCRRRLLRLRHDPTFQILGPMEPMEEARPRRRRTWLAVGIFAGVIALVTFGAMPLALAAMFGAFLVFVTGCITPERAYKEVDWKVIVLIGSLLGLSVAMDKSGTATYLAQLIASLAGHTHPLWLLSGFFVLTVLLTQPMSNQAAAIVILPVAIQTANHLALNPRTFAVMIAVAASCSYLTPLEPACLMVYGPGRYRFADFFKVGAGLTLLIYLIAIVFVPWFWPLRS
jgi:di/tricarboxylate transporter